MTNDQWRYTLRRAVFCLSSSSIQLKNRIKPALVKTGHALDAFFLVDPGDLFLFPSNGIGRATAKTKPAFGARFRINFKF